MTVFVVVTVFVNVLVAQMQCGGFSVTVTVTAFGIGTLHGSTTVIVVGKHDFVGLMIEFVGNIPGEEIKHKLHYHSVFVRKLSKQGTPTLFYDT